MRAFAFVVLLSALIAIARGGRRHVPRWAWFAGRAAGVLGLVAAVFVGSFAVMRGMPGGPFDAEARLDPAVRARLAERALDGRDRAWSAFDGLLGADLGPSLGLRDFSSGEVLAQGARRSLALGGRALLLAVALGVTLGLAAAVAGGRLDRFVRGCCDVAPTIPAFTLGAVLIWIVSFVARWQPPAALDGRPPHLPVVAAALPAAALFARLVRDEAFRLRDATFLKAARSRGASGMRVLVVHLSPAAFVPAAAYLGPAAASLLTGTVAVEAVFGIPGLGTHMVQAALSRDLPVVVGATTLYAAALGVCNLAGDLLSARLTPGGESE